MRKKGITTNTFWWGAGISALVLSVFCVFVYSGQKSETVLKEPDFAKPVKSIRVTVQKNETTRTFPGMVKAASETKLGFRVGGTIYAFQVNVGQKVEKGEIIARLDPRDFKVEISRLNALLKEAKAGLSAMENGTRKEEIEALKASVKAGKANLERSTKQLARFDKLILDQIITKDQYDKALADYEISRAEYDSAVQKLKKAENGVRQEDLQGAKARVQQIEVNIEAAQHALADTVLKAPFSGIINQKFSELYENITQGQPVVTLLDCSSAEMTAAVPEKIMLNRNRFSRLSVILDAYPGQDFPAKVKEFGLKTSMANQSFPLTVSLESYGEIQAHSGMTATLSVTYQEKNLNRSIVLPSSAVFSDSSGVSCVWKIDPASLTISKVRIRILDTRKDKVLINKGLEKGDLIVAAGARFLVDNQKIKLLNSEKGS